MNILLIEDSSTLAQLFGVQLQQLGHSLIVAETKAEALAYFETQTFDLVFVDMGLEGQQDRGLQIMIEMKALVPNQRLGVLSSNDLRDMVRRSQEAGAEFYMVKPFTMDGLMVVLSGDKQAIQTYQPEIGEGRIIYFQ
jgi:two-component system chemotaxis response regulator CheY